MPLDPWEKALYKCLIIIVHWISAHYGKVLTSLQALDVLSFRGDEVQSVDRFT